MLVHLIYKVNKTRHVVVLQSAPVKYFKRGTYLTLRRDQTDGSHQLDRLQHDERNSGVIIFNPLIPRPLQANVDIKRLQETKHVRIRRHVIVKTLGKETSARHSNEKKTFYTKFVKCLPF